MTEFFMGPARRSSSISLNNESLLRNIEAEDVPLEQPLEVAKEIGMSDQDCAGPPVTIDQDTTSLVKRLVNLSLSINKSVDGVVGQWKRPVGKLKASMEEMRDAVAPVPRGPAMANKRLNRAFSRAYSVVE